MSLSLLVDLCGLPLTIMLVVLSLALSTIAFYLAFIVKQEKLLAVFLPMTMIPLFSGLLMTFFAMLSSVAMELNSESMAVIESGLLLQMNLIPMLAGMIAALIPALVASIGRWRLVWLESGIMLFPKKDRETTEVDPQAWLSQETDEYLERLTRPR